MIHVLFSFGTRPEAIKLAPVIKHLQQSPSVFDVKICLTSQHLELLRQVTDFFRISENVDLNIMTHDQTLEYITSSVVTKMRDVLHEYKPDVLLIQGDTTTVFAAALAAFYQKVKVGHVEAGLRTYNKFSPFPEEMNRKLATALTDFHFTPTLKATQNLLAEGVPEDAIIQTGNTVVDALNLCLEKLNSFSAAIRKGILLETGLSEEVCVRIFGKKIKLILVTAHRRESFGEPFEEMCLAMRDIIDANPDVEIVYPVHPNPNVRAVVNNILTDNSRVHLINPVRYEQLICLMERSELLLTDSGGIQEEGPSLSKPVLVMREVTERPEGVEAGVSLLVGTRREKIVNAVQRLLHDRAAYADMTNRTNPYGDGKASERIAQTLRERFASVVG